MADLKTDYKDDILDTSANEKRKYTMTSNSDGTVSLDDATEYTQEGDSFGAADINGITAQVNASVKSATANAIELVAQLPETGTEGTVYFTYADVAVTPGGTGLSASETSYDNTTSELNSSDVQGAIDEIDDKMDISSGAISSSVEGCALEYYYNSFMAHIHLQLSADIAQNTLITLANLPETITPSTDCIFDIVNTSGTLMRVFIKASGVLQIYKYSTTTALNTRQAFTYFM